MNRLTIVKITKGDLHDYLKDIEIIGKKEDNGEFIIFGCKNEQQSEFYKGILEYDKVAPVQGFETVEEVKHWWEECADMMLCIGEGEYEVIQEV